MIRSLQLRLIPWLIVLLSTLSLSVHAASFYAAVSKNKVAKNEVFQLRVISDQKVAADAINFQVLERDFLTSRPSFASSVNVVNGQRSNRSEWNISLAVNRLGVVTIPSFTLNGQQTQPIAIQVTADGQAPQTDELIELHSTLSRQALYPNESVLLHTRLIIKADLRRLQNPQITPPTIEGMELNSASEAKQYQTVFEGMEVTVLEQDFRLTAQQAGHFTLTEPKFQGSLVYSHPLDGSTRLIPINTTPKTYSLTVEEKPADYQGVWLPTSQLSLTEQWLDSQGSKIESPSFSTTVGDAISREITLQVTGLTAEQLPHIALSYPDSISVYEEKPQLTTLENGDVVMKVTQVLIPRRSGETKLPDITLNWWDTLNRKQQTAHSAGLILSVTASDTDTDTQLTPVTPDSPVVSSSVVVTDAGFWPYLTALFALLWLITALIAWRLGRSQPQVATEVTPQEQNAWQQLQHAITSQDGIAISHALKRWMDGLYLSQEEQSQLEQALNTLNSQLYSASAQSANYHELQKLIKQIQRRQATGQGQHSYPLAKL